MNEPLAQRLRPKTLADVCGQQHLLAEGQVFRRTIESGRIPNMIFYGPSGTGKTTVARIIAENSFTVQDNDLGRGSNLLSAYKCLKINLINLSCHCIVVNFLDQDIIYLTLDVEVDLTAFMFDL